MHLRQLDSMPLPAQSPHIFFTARPHSPLWHLALSTALSRNFSPLRCAGSVLSGFSPSSWQKEVGQGEKRKGEKSTPGNGKVWCCGVELSLVLDRLSLRGWSKCNRQLGKADKPQDREKIFSPCLAESSLPPYLLSLLPRPFPGQDHIA